MNLGRWLSGGLREAKNALFEKRAEQVEHKSQEVLDEAQRATERWWNDVRRADGVLDDGKRTERAHRQPD